MITVIHEQRETPLPGVQASGDALWLDRDAIEQATGWTWKPEGLCHGDTCVPLPRGGDLPMVRGDLLNLSAMWSYMGHPVAHDVGTWVLGIGAQQRAQAMADLVAPDFTLPDLDGKPHKLSDYRGKKVLLATWASW